LSLLESLDTKIRKAILVSGYAESLRKDGASTEKPELNWEKIKEHVQDIVFVNSDNDPWKCDDKQGKIMQEHLGGTLIVMPGEGHMGSTTYNQPYKEFPLVVEQVIGSKEF
jgi:predicted alpha/beta hydrolase family esterase